jgi:hypothetical protein
MVPDTGCFIAAVTHRANQALAKRGIVIDDQQ